MIGKQKNPLLKVSSINKKFGGLKALKNVSTEVPYGALKAIIGPNGAGKTTTFNMISGLLKIDEGEIWFVDQNITKCSPTYRANLGIARTFQHPRIYQDMSVLENVVIAASGNAQKYFLQSFLGGFLDLLPINKIAKAAEKKALEMLEFVGLAHKANDSAKILAFGEQKTLELARALALEPKLLLLDEPTAGLNSEEAKAFMELLLKLKKTNLSILMIEHRMDLVANVSDEVLVLNFGEVLADDKPETIWADAKVIDAYLGANEGKEKEIREEAI